MARRSEEVKSLLTERLRGLGVEVMEEHDDSFKANSVRAGCLRLVDYEAICEQDDIYAKRSICQDDSSLNFFYDRACFLLGLLRHDYRKKFACGAEAHHMPSTIGEVRRCVGLP